MAFTKKQITVTFQLGTGQFGNTGFNTVTVSGLRIQATIIKSGGPSMGECQLRIHGLKPDIYNAIVQVYAATEIVHKNTVIVCAGDDSSSVLPTVFTGQITSAQIDLNAQPDCVLNVIAQTGLVQAVQNIPDTSRPAPVNAVTILSNLAAQMNLNFENYMPGPVMMGAIHYSGSAKSQAEDLAMDAHINLLFDDNNVMAIWPQGGSRSGSVPLFSPDTGMVGYPSFSTQGMMFKSLYNPNVIFGGQIEVKSSILAACGLWTVFGLTHTLESETPGGAWFTEVQGFSQSAMSS